VLFLIAKIENAMICRGNGMKADLGIASVRLGASGIEK
jgi:hypothetical protein